MAVSHKLAESLKRLRRYEAELPRCDPPTCAQLLAAWKKQIMEDLAELFTATDDPELISNVDRAVALSSDNCTENRAKAH